MVKRANGPRVRNPLRNVSSRTIRLERRLEVARIGSGQANRIPSQPVGAAGLPGPSGGPRPAGADRPGRDLRPGCGGRARLGAASRPLGGRPRWRPRRRAGRRGARAGGDRWSARPGCLAGGQGRWINRSGNAGSRCEMMLVTSRRRGPRLQCSPMPIPRSLFARDTPQDHDLTVLSGPWPAGLTGELVISAPHPDTFDGPHPFFGEGMTYRLSLQPGTPRRRPDDASPGARRAIDSPVGPAAGQAARRVHADDDRRAVAVRARQRGQHRAAAVGRPPVHDLGRRAARSRSTRSTLGFLGEVGHRVRVAGLRGLPPAGAAAWS